MACRSAVAGLIGVGLAAAEVRKGSPESPPWGSSFDGRKA